MQVLVVATVAVLGEVHAAVPVDEIFTVFAFLTDFVSSLVFDLVNNAFLDVEHPGSLSFEVFCRVLSQIQWHESAEYSAISGLDYMKSGTLVDHVLIEVFFGPAIFRCLVNLLEILFMIEGFSVLHLKTVGLSSRHDS